MHAHRVLIIHLGWLENVGRGLEHWRAVVYIGHELILWRVHCFKFTLFPLRLFRRCKEVVDDDFLLVNAGHASPVLVFLVVF